MLDPSGDVREVIRATDRRPVNATALDLGSVADLFVSNVLNGMTNGPPAATTQGDVVRLTLELTGTVSQVIASTVITNGISVHTDPAALVIGPTGVALSPAGPSSSPTPPTPVSPGSGRDFPVQPGQCRDTSATVSAGKPSTARSASPSRPMVTC